MICRSFGHYSLCLWAESTRLQIRGKWIARIPILLALKCPGNRIEVAQLCYSAELFSMRRGHG
jgi:hypothetical protein